MPSENIEKAVYVSSVRDLSEISRRSFSRIYYGAEFCENLIPLPGQVTRVSTRARKEGFALSFLTPYCTDAGLEKLSKIFSLLPDRTEVILNDFGVLKRMREMGLNNLIPVLGRLLVKYKRDPRITFFKMEKRLMGYLRSSNINIPEFQEFLLRNGINRIEIENSFQGYNFRPDKNIRVSLYYPYVYISTAVRCVFKRALNLPDCRRDCHSGIIKSTVSGLPVNIITRGNTEFYSNSRLDSTSALKILNMDRMVFFARPPF